jgi:hypothetical protein
MHYRHPTRVTEPKDSGYMIPVERIDSAILEIRGQKVMLDYDLAAIYGVSTKALNQAVKRNRDRFPEGSVFQLTTEEKAELVTNCDRLVVLKHSSRAASAVGRILVFRDCPCRISHEHERPGTRAVDQESGHSQASRWLL